MFKGNQQVKVKKINMALDSNPKPKRDIPRIDLKKEAIFVFNPSTIEKVSTKIQKNIWPDASEAECLHFFNIVYAILKSIRRDALVLYTKEPMVIDHYIKGCFSALRTLEKPKDFDSQLIHTKINSRYSYYEQQYDYRSMIQNYDWDYQYKVEKERKDKTIKTELHWLSDDVMTFIKLREKYRMIHEDFKLFKNLAKSPECEVCHMLGATFRPSIKRHFCSYCYQYDKLEFYLKVCNCFHLMGSFFMFYFYMPESTFYYIFKNKAKIFEVFNKELTATPLELYNNHEELKKFQTVEDVIKEEIRKSNEGDMMMKMIQEIADKSEEEAKKTREERYKTLLLEVNEIKREIRDKEKKKEKRKKKMEEEEEDIGVDIDIKSAPSKEEKSEEQAAYLKGLSAYFDPNNQDEIGDKSLESRI